MLSNKVSLDKNGFKYYNGCKDDENVKLLCIMLLTMSRYGKSLDETSI